MYLDRTHTLAGSVTEKLATPAAENLVLPWRLGVLVLWGVIAFSSTGFAQDPFGEIPDVPIENGIDLPAETATGGSGAPAFSVDVFERNAVVRSLIYSPPKTPADLARAVELMARIRRWDQVTIWLNEIERRGLDESSAFSMVQQVGAKTFQAIDSPLVKLGDKEKAIARKIVELSNQFRLNPTFLSRNVQELQGVDSKAWKPSFEAVRSSGYPGVQSFFNGLMRDDSPAPNAAMSEALSKLGEPALDAWIVAMRSPHEDVRRNLLLLAASSRDARYQRELAAAFTDRDRLPSGVSEVANQWLRRSRSEKDSERLYAEAIDRLSSLLSSYNKERFSNDASVGVEWKLGGDGRTLEFHDCKPAEVAWARVVSEAENVLQFGAGQERDSALALAILLQSRTAEVPAQEPLETGVWDNHLDRYEFACMVWDAAVRHDFPVAQRHAAAVLSRFDSPMPIEVRDRLAQALDVGYRAVRYTAAYGLMQSINQSHESGVPMESFRGRSRLDRVALEMTQLAPKRRAVIVGGSSSLRSHVRALLEEYQYLCEEFSNAGTLIARCKEGAPIDEIYVVSSLLEMDMGQVVQRIRGTPSAATAPIAMLADNLSSREISLLLLDPRTVLASVPAELSGLEPILSDVRWVGRSVSMSDEEKILWKEAAERFREVQISRLVRSQPPPSAPSLPQTPAGQRELILKAIDKAISLPEREQASQIFVQSVRQFGLLVSSETADALYDVYNERAKTDSQLRGILGRILDAVEASRGSRDWSTLAP